MSTLFWINVLILMLLLFYFPEVYEEAYEYEMRTCIEPCNHTNSLECGCNVGGLLSWDSPESHKNYYENYANK